MKCLVSVIVPVYNSALYLNDALDSICNQSLRDIEIICVDDGSTDRSLEILKEYAKTDPRIHILTQKRKGGGVARNVGLSVANGKYCIFLDSDDFFNIELLSVLYSESERYQTDITICFGNKYNTISKEYYKPEYLNYAILPQIIPFSFQDIPNTIFQISSIAVWNKLFLREFLIVNNIKFQEILRYNDVLFCFTALTCAKKISYVNKSLINYRVGMKTNCQMTTSETPLAFYDAYSTTYAMLKSKAIIDLVRRSFFNRMISVMILQLKKLYTTNEFKTLYNKININAMDDFDLEILKPSDFNNKLYYLAILTITSVPFETKIKWKMNILWFIINHLDLTVHVFLENFSAILKILKKYLLSKF